ncbi:endonuclease/exonuclease/phosphatase family protein [Roseivivax sediminis]|uniref:Metal-dependent hydrolase, endonuclease/exonuclease/phosphatase family n=1 Tax=Roseivivax sediminis TaxID=936889 RepID=A0A1I1YUY7_9RHOB|nr:endonuclease/exonuclease/phosphatase family protein [Roseivivax sediminis]SFE23122.1 Metal-dependent hydrolase, endonuclease/exonuclease/phosphatase family [Roseivivax sediminis]
MKTALRLLALVLALPLILACALHIANSGSGALPPRAEGALRVATHNVHYIRARHETGRWSVGDWQGRAPSLDAAFKAMEADLVAFQEMETFSGGNSDDVNLARSYLLDRNPGYAAAAIGDWRDFPSTQPIFYRTDRLSLRDQGWFFFSETPERIYARSFDGSYPAFASWAEFATTSGRAFRVLNVHFDAASGDNRLKSAELVVRRLAAWPSDIPVLLLGDLNARAGAPTLDILEEAGFDFAPTEGATYHFDRGVNLFGAIDHIASGAGLTRVGGPVVLRRRFAGDWPSDHYPVIADYRLGD